MPLSLCDQLLCLSQSLSVKHKPCPKGSWGSFPRPPSAVALQDTRGDAHKCHQAVQSPFRAWCPRLRGVCADPKGPAGLQWWSRLFEKTWLPLVQGWVWGSVVLSCTFWRSWFWSALSWFFIESIKSRTRILVCLIPTLLASSSSLISPPSVQGVSLSYRFMKAGCKISWL